MPHTTVKKPTRRTDALDRLRQIAEPTNQTASWRTHVRKHPWLALGVAAGVGVACGLSPKLRHAALALLVRSLR